MHLTLIVLLSLAYLLYFIYDWRNAACPQAPFAGRFFALATALTAAATVIFIYKSIKFAGGARTVVFLPLAISAFIGLIAAVFFALPQGTYSEPGTRRKAYTGGLYALCRHPGVLAYCLFYVFLFAAMPSAQGAGECAMFCAADILYMLFQDLWSFPRIFSDYNEYKKTTPMFLPTWRSVRRCIASYKSAIGEGDR